MSEFIEKYKEISGREVATEEEAVKHFQNLSELAFSKKEKFKEEFQVEANAILELKLKEKEEELNKALEPFKKFVEDAGVDITKVNPLAIKEYIGESHEDIKPRTQSVDTEAEKKDLERRAKNGDKNARQELVKRIYNK